MNSVYTNIIPHKIRRFNPIGAHETVTPYSVTEIVKTFEKVNGVAVNHIYVPRRDGDLPNCYANVDKALKMLGWKNEKPLEEMCRDLWKWQQI